MFKWVSWVIRMGATALLLSFLCIWTTGYIVNSYMESVIKQLDLPIDIQPIAMSGVWGTLWGANKAPSPSNPSLEAQHSQKEEDNGLAELEASGSPADLSGDRAAAGASDEKNREANASPDPSSNLSAEEDDAAPVFNGQAAGAQLTDQERQALYAMVVSKLNPEQLNQLSSSLQGGLTSEELSQLQDMLQSALTEQEYTQMMELLQHPEKTDTDDVSN